LLAAGWTPAFATVSGGFVGVLVDMTDPMSADLSHAARDQVTEALTVLNRGDELAVFVLDAQSPIPRQVWSTVSPGRGSEANPWTEGPEFMEERFNELVAFPLDSVLVAVMAERSPTGATALGDAIGEIYVSGECARGPRRRRLIIVSDFVENSALFSFYRQRAARALPFATLDLAGGSVDMIVVLRQRDALVQNAHLLGLWIHWFKACGARVHFHAVGDKR
jgi:hypothetical protein